jgi:hypothetical protein
VTHSAITVSSMVVRICRVALYLAALCSAIPLLAATPNETKAPAGEHLRLSAEQRRAYEKHMLERLPTTPGCFVATIRNPHWVPTKCLPAPRTPSPHRLEGKPFPNNVGYGTDWFATVSTGNISQTTGSFDSFENVQQIDGFKGGHTTTLYQNTYELQMNANTFATTAFRCNIYANCVGWEQFLMSQKQYGSSPSAFIEYWLLNYPPPCPSPAWTYNDIAGTTPGCFLNTTPTGLPAVSVTDLGSLRVIAKVVNGNDNVIVSDAYGTLGLNSNPSILNLGAGWTGVEYGLFGDCCATESYFTATTTASLTVRVAVVNGTTNPPNCATVFTGDTAETNNLYLTGGCKPVGGVAPAIVFTMSGGGPLPLGFSVGEPHLITVHGTTYNFQDAGEYILAEAGDFQVQARQVIMPPGNRALAINTGVAVKMGQGTFSATLQGIAVDGRPRTMIDGQEIPLAGGAIVGRRGVTYTVSDPTGDIVQINVFANYIDVYVIIGKGNAASVRGILAGSDNGHPPFVNHNGTAVQPPVTAAKLRNFAETWRVEPNKSLFSADGRPRPSGPIEPFTVGDLDKEEAEQARKLCLSRGAIDAALLDDCILDVGLFDKPEVADPFVFAPKPKRVIPDR